MPLEQYTFRVDTHTGHMSSDDNLSIHNMGIMLNQGWTIVIQQVIPSENIYYHHLLIVLHKPESEDTDGH